MNRSGATDPDTAAEAATDREDTVANLTEAREEVIAEEEIVVVVEEDTRKIISSSPSFFIFLINLPKNSFLNSIWTIQ